MAGSQFNFQGVVANNLMGNAGPLPEMATPSPEDHDKDIVADLNHLWRQEKDKRITREIEWSASWARFNNDWNHEGKRHWQSRMNMPAYAIAGLKFAWETVKPIVLAQDSWFELTPLQSKFKPFADVIKGIVLEQLKPSGANPKTNFYSQWYDFALGMAIAENGYLLITPVVDGHRQHVADSMPLDPENDIELPDMSDSLPPLNDDALPPMSGNKPLSIKEMNKRFHVRVEALNPRNVLIDTVNISEPNYVMWEQSMYPHEFRKYAEAVGWQNIDAAIRDCYTENTDSQAREMAEKKETNHPSEYGRIRLRHFIGTLPKIAKKDGTIHFEMRHCVWVGNTLVGLPQDPNIWHGQVPICVGSMIRRPWAAFGMSLLMLNRSPMETHNQLLNMTVDYLHQSANPPVEIDWDLMHQATGFDAFKNGVYPGMPVHVQRMGRSGSAVMRSGQPDMNAGFWQGLGYFKTAMGEMSTLAETGAMPRTRNRISKTEFQERQAASSGIWQLISENLENEVLTPMLYQVYLLILQMCPQDMWQQAFEAEIAKLEDQEKNSELVKELARMAGLTPRQRWEELATAYKFDVKVYTAQESKRQRLESVATLTSMANSMPGLASRVKWHKMGELAVISLDEDPKEFLWPNEGSTAESFQPPADNTGRLAQGVEPVSPVAPPAPGGFGAV